MTIQCRLFIAALIVIFPSSPADTYDELRVKAVNFERHYDPFVRNLFGCPPLGETTVETCTLPPFINYGEYQKARIAAIKLFDLKE